MTTNHDDTMQLGELVVAAFDRAAHRTENVRRMAWLARQDVMRTLRRAQRHEDEVLANRWSEIVRDRDF